MYDACMVRYVDLVPRFCAVTSVQKKWPAAEGEKPLRAIDVMALNHFLNSDAGWTNFLVGPWANARSHSRC
jgi:hypothetical protein